MKVTTSTGVVLDTEGGMAKSITEHAMSKGFKNIICCLATFPDESREYVLLEDNAPIYSNIGYESVCVYLDVLALNTFGRAVGKRG